MRNNLRLSGAEPHVVVDECVLHGERVAGATEWGQGVRVRVLRRDNFAVGVSGCVGWGRWWWGAPFECPQDRLRQAQGERTREAPLRRGVGEAMGEGDAPPRAPLDSCLRRNDARGGVRAGGGCWWCRGESPAAAGRALREAPLRCVGGVGDATGVGGGGAPPGVRAPFDFPEGERTPPHLCIHVCAGMARARGPSTGSGRTEFARRAHYGVWGSRRCDGAGGGGAPPLAPLDTGFRRYDDGDVRANKCCWWRRGESPAAAGRALREAPLRRGGGRGCGAGWWWGRPAPSPSGYRLSPVRRWGCAGQ